MRLQMVVLQQCLNNLINFYYCRFYYIQVTWLAFKQPNKFLLLQMQVQWWLVWLRLNNLINFYYCRFDTAVSFTFTFKQPNKFLLLQIAQRFFFYTLFKQPNKFTHSYFYFFMVFTALAAQAVMAIAILLLQMLWNSIYRNRFKQPNKFLLLQINICFLLCQESLNNLINFYYCRYTDGW